MCGIFGTTMDCSENELHTILKLLDHRGPDSNGSVKLAVDKGDLTLVHTRLAIQDLSAEGHQPMYSRSGRWVITFNGEIYNHLELRKQLDLAWRGTSDTETLVEYLDTFGIDKTVRVLNGIFAFGAYDCLERVLYVCRDPFGVKPVYYSQVGDRLSFASEIKPLLVLNSNGFSLDNSALSLFLSLRYVPSPHTLLTGIQRLPPGHMLVSKQNGSADVVSYIEATYEKYTGSYEQATSDYKAIMARAVEQQLISDVPVGVLLSGGIDSAIIAALARERSSELTAFTVGFGGRYDECEIEDAKATADQLGIAHEAVEVVPEGLIETLDDIVAAIEEPLGTTSVMPMWYLTQLARKQSTVVLAGQGNDEPWAGYNRYKFELMLQKLPFLASKPFRGAAHLGGFVRSDTYRRGLQCLGYAEEPARFARAYSLFDQREMNMLGVPPSELAEERISYWLDLLVGGNNMSGIEKMTRIDTRMNLADDLLLYGDKVSMAYALEVRVPMLDPNVIRFVESLPMAYKATMRRNKIVHRQMAQSYLPDAIINRPKKGFQVPFGQWSRTVWKDFVAAKLLAPEMVINNVLDPKGLRQLWAHHQKGTFDYSRQLFALLTLSLWLERYGRS